MQICTKCYQELVDSDTECYKCKSTKLLTTIEYKECKKFYTYNDKGTSQDEEYPYNVYIKYLTHKKRIEKFEYDRLHPPILRDYHTASTPQQSTTSTPQYIPKCPTCGSPNIRKIDGIERGASIAVFGIFSKKINKTFKCKNCGHTW